MATNARIYVVRDQDGQADSAANTRLVKASSQAQAIGHVVRARYTAGVAKQDELVRLMGAGVKVEEASAD